MVGWALSRTFHGVFCPQALKTDSASVNRTQNVLKHVAFVFFILIVYIHVEMYWENT